MDDPRASRYRRIMSSRQQASTSSSSFTPSATAKRPGDICRIQITLPEENNSKNKKTFKAARKTVIVTAGLVDDAVIREEIIGNILDGDIAETTVRTNNSKDNSQKGLGSDDDSDDADHEATLLASMIVSACSRLSFYQCRFAESGKSLLRRLLQKLPALSPSFDCPKEPILLLEFQYCCLLNLELSNILEYAESIVNLPSRSNVHLFLQGDNLADRDGLMQLLTTVSPVLTKLHLNKTSASFNTMTLQEYGQQARHCLDQVILPFIYDISKKDNGMCPEAMRKAPLQELIIESYDFPAARSTEAENTVVNQFQALMNQTLLKRRNPLPTSGSYLQALQISGITCIGAHDLLSSLALILEGSGSCYVSKLRRLKLSSIRLQGYSQYADINRINQALRQNSTLEELTLSWVVGLGAHIVEYVFQALADNHKLRHLHLVLAIVEPPEDWFESTALLLDQRDDRIQGTRTSFRRHHETTVRQYMKRYLYQNTSLQHCHLHFSRRQNRSLMQLLEWIVERNKRLAQVKRMLQVKPDPSPPKQQQKHSSILHQPTPSIQTTPFLLSKWTQDDRGHCAVYLFLQQVLACLV
mmetsp:Transcript_14817/g.40944  ORF Transcript_14817/g.40944 Transcript_14817/m.40944 type:complete len:585 (+) Transcript_14817:144-1898(+)